MDCICCGFVGKPNDILYPSTNNLPVLGSFQFKNELIPIKVTDHYIFSIGSWNEKGSFIGWQLNREEKACLKKVH